MLVRGSPFCAGGRDMTSNRRRIHAVTGIVGHRLDECRCDRLPYPLVAPSSKALIDRHPLPVLFGHIAPWRTGTDAPQNAVDDHAVVEGGATFSAPLSRQQILQQPPLRFAQIAATQSRLPPRGILESSFESCVNNFVNRA